MRDKPPHGQKSNRSCSSGRVTLSVCGSGDEMMTGRNRVRPRNWRAGSALADSHSRHASDPWIRGRDFCRIVLITVNGTDGLDGMNAVRTRAISTVLHHRAIRLLLRSAEAIIASHCQHETSLSRIIIWTRLVLLIFCRWKPTSSFPYWISFILTGIASRLMISSFIG